MAKHLVDDVPVPNIRMILAAGVTFPSAVKAALGDEGLRAFSRLYDIDPAQTTSCIRGTYPNTRVRNHLALHFNVSREWVDQQIAAYKESKK